MLNVKDILATQDMIDKRHLDIRTITMGISLLDCADNDVEVCARKIYDKITRKAENLVKTGQDIEWEFGIPIVNKRISVKTAILPHMEWRRLVYADVCAVHIIHRL